MIKIEEVVLSCHNKLLKELKIEKKSSLDMEFSRENGISSLGIVSLIILLEEELKIDLDDYLMPIRECKTLADLVEVLKNVIE